MTLHLISFDFTMTRKHYKNSKFMDEILFPSITADLMTLSKIVKAELLQPITNEQLVTISEALEDLTNFSTTIETKIRTKELQRLIRLYIFLFTQDGKRTSESQKIFQGNSTEAIETLLKKCVSISKAIGIPPLLNYHVELVDAQFFSDRTKTNLKEIWQKTPCETPMRGEPIVTGVNHKIGFAGRVREELRANVEEVYTLSEQTARKNLTYYLNLTDLEFYPDGLLAADHMQSSCDLIDRLQEMIIAMNHDPGFAAEMLAFEGDRGYFCTDKSTNIIYGSYWLYIVYHNSIENLWFLLASENSGEKGSKDPIQWLKNTDMGCKYLIENEAHINKDGVLYGIKEEGGTFTSLKDSFIKWTLNSHNTIIKIFKAMTKNDHSLREAVISFNDLAGQNADFGIEMRILINYFSELLRGFIASKAINHQFDAQNNAIFTNMPPTNRESNPRLSDVEADEVEPSQDRQSVLSNETANSTQLIAKGVE